MKLNRPIKGTCQICAGSYRLHVDPPHAIRLHAMPPLGSIGLGTPCPGGGMPPVQQSTQFAAAMRLQLSRALRALHDRRGDIAAGRAPPMNLRGMAAVRARLEAQQPARADASLAAELRRIDIKIEENRTSIERIDRAMLCVDQGITTLGTHPPGLEFIDSDGTRWRIDSAQRTRRSPLRPDRKRPPTYLCLPIKANPDTKPIRFTAIQVARGLLRAISQNTDKS